MITVIELVMYLLEGKAAKMEIVGGMFTQGCAPRFSYDHYL